MRALFTQLSGMIGLLTFLNQLINEATLERALFLGLTTGVAVYVVLLVGDLAIHRILASAPAVDRHPTPEAETPVEAPQAASQAAAPRTDQPARPRNTPNPEALAA